jgi:hypothetical protein
MCTMRLPVALAAALAGRQCLHWFTSQQAVLITSEPLGAHIAIDGRVTAARHRRSSKSPAISAGDHIVSLSKRGTAR